MLPCLSFLPSLSLPSFALQQESFPLFVSEGLPAAHFYPDSTPLPLAVLLVRFQTPGQALMTGCSVLSSQGVPVSLAVSRSAKVWLPIVVLVN